MGKHRTVLFFKASEIIGRRVDGSTVRSISVRGRPIRCNGKTTRTEIQARGGGMITRVMISEVLFGYFLFEEKVTK
jgi:hypothetical protein